MIVVRTVLRLAAALALTGGLGLATRLPAAAQDGDPISVVATFSVLGDLVLNVGGDRVDVHVLVPSGADAHTFEPTPEDAAALEDADLIVENGFGFEPWLDDLYDAADSDAPRIVATDGITPRSAEGDEASPESDGDDHEHGELDPHVWHDVHNAIKEVENIRDGLAAADPDSAATYQANAGAYLAQLNDLDGYVVQQVATLPQDRRKLVTSHDTFGYFADRYGFQIVGTALGSVSTEGGDPSAEQVARLVDEIKATGVPAIFAENVSNPALMQTIADEAGVTLAPTLYTDALGEPGSSGETYLGMIRYNVDTIVTALSA